MGSKDKNIPELADKAAKTVKKARDSAYKNIGKLEIGESLIRCLDSAHLIVLNIDSYELSPNEYDLVAIGTHLEFLAQKVQLLDILLSIVRVDSKPIDKEATEALRRGIDGISEAANQLKEYLESPLYPKIKKEFQTQLDSERDKYETDLRFLKERMAETDRELRRALEEKNRIVDSLKIAAGESGSLSLAKDYIAARRFYDGIVSKSLFWAIIAGVVTIGLSLTLVQSTSASSMVELLDHYVPRILPLTISATALVYSLKSYQAAMHNSVLCHQREILFRTMGAFVNSQQDLSTRNAIVMKIVSTAAEMQPTGFLSGQTESPQINQFNQLKKSFEGD